MSHVSDDAIKDLRSKISSIRFGMMTTQGSENSLTSRPMTQQALDNDGTLWFFTADNSEPAIEINSNPLLNVSFANPGESVYVSISGNAEIIKSREKAAQLWNPAVAAWFPEGLDDPHLSLIKLSISTAEFWDSHTNKMMQIFAIAKAAIVGERPKDIGQHEKIDFN